jgi:hypothetical protein
MKENSLIHEPAPDNKGQYLYCIIAYKRNSGCIDYGLYSSDSILRRHISEADVTAEWSNIMWIDAQRENDEVAYEDVNILKSTRAIGEDELWDDVPYVWLNGYSDEAKRLYVKAEEIFVQRMQKEKDEKAAREKQESEENIARVQAEERREYERLRAKFE